MSGAGPGAGPGSTAALLLLSIRFDYLSSRTRPTLRMADDLVTFLPACLSVCSCACLFVQRDCGAAYQCIWLRPSVSARARVSAAQCRAGLRDVPASRSTQLEICSSLGPSPPCPTLCMAEGHVAARCLGPRGEARREGAKALRRGDYNRCPSCFYLGRGGAGRGAAPRGQCDSVEGVEDGVSNGHHHDGDRHGDSDRRARDAHKPKPG